MKPEENRWQPEANRLSEIDTSRWQIIKRRQDNDIYTWNGNEVNNIAKDEQTADAKKDVC